MSVAEGQAAGGEGARLRRRRVRRTDRIRVTERLVRSAAAGRVLELGAGDHSFAAAACGPQVDSWTSVDFAPPCDVRCDLDREQPRLPFPDGCFGLVVCTEVLEHLRWPLGLLGEIRRVLRPGAALIASVPNAVSLTYRVAWALGRLPSCAASANIPPELGGTGYPCGESGVLGGHLADFNARRFTSLLRSAGFEAGRLRGSGIIWHRQLLPHWLVPAPLASNLICVARRRA